MDSLDSTGNVGAVLSGCATLQNCGVPRDDARHQDDHERAIADGGKGSTLSRWLFFRDFPWKIYGFKTFHTPVPLQLGSDSDIWRSRPDFQEAEYGLVLAADKRDWNSAPGGILQTFYEVPNELAQVQVSDELTSWRRFYPSPPCRNLCPWARVHSVR